MANTSLQVLRFGNTGSDKVVEGNKHRRSGRCLCQESAVGTDVRNLACQLGAVRSAGVGCQAALQLVSMLVRLSALEVGSVEIAKV